MEHDLKKDLPVLKVPLVIHCKKGICVKKKFGVLAGSKGTYPELN